MTESKIAKPAVKAHKSLVIAALAILSLLIGALLVAFLPQALADKDAKPFTLTILHTNDIHAHDQTFQDRGKQVGGMARLGHLIRELRKANKEHTIVADAGDIFQGTVFFTRYHGEVEVELLNMIGYDVYTIGNHEFDDGAVNLADQLEKAKFDVLNCNLNADALPKLKAIIKPSVVKTIGGEKVGFIGAITPDIESLSLTRDGVDLKKGQPLKPGTRDDLSWLSPIKDEVERLVASGVNKIILVTHCGVEVDKILAAEIPQIDAIIGGHSHTRLEHGIMVAHDDGTHTLIVQTGNYGRNLGKLSLVFNAQGVIDVSASHSDLEAISDSIPEDKDIRDYLERKGEPLKVLHDTILSDAVKDFDNNFRGMKTDSALGDLICDSFYEAGKPDKADITFENRGGIRSRIEKGPISLEKVEELLPFENHLVFADVSGERLKTTLEHSVSGATGGKFLDVHGLKFAYDTEKKFGDRIVFMLAEKNGKWEEVSPSATYRIGMTDYSFKGGEGYQFPDAKNIKYTDLKLNEYLKRYLQSHPKVKPQYGDRIAWISNSVMGSALAGDFSDSPALSHCSDLKVDLYTSDRMGVGTIYSGGHSNAGKEGKEDKAGKERKLSVAVLPLEQAEEIEKDIPVKQFAEHLQKDELAGKLKRYCAIVVRGENQAHAQPDVPVYSYTKILQTVSYPIRKEDLFKK